MDLPTAAHHEVDGDEDVEVCRLGMATRPHEDGLEGAVAENITEGGIVEGCVVYDARHAACGGVCAAHVVWEVVLAECRVVRQQAADTGVSFGARLLFCLGGELREALHPFAVLLPQAAGVFLFACDGHIPLLLYVGPLQQELVVQPVQDLDKGQGDLRITLGPILHPIGEGHEDIDRLHDVGLLVEAFDDGGELD